MLITSINSARTCQMSINRFPPRAAQNNAIGISRGRKIKPGAYLRNAREEHRSSLPAYSRQVSRLSRKFTAPKFPPPLPQFNSRALCAPTGDPYTPIIRSRLQPFDAGAPGGNPWEKEGEYRRQICAPTTSANRLRQTAIVRAALARKRMG